MSEMVEKKAELTFHGVSPTINLLTSLDRIHYHC